MTETPVATHSFAAITIYQPAAESKAAGLDVSDVLARATAGPAGPLPHRLQLERRLGRSLAGVEAYFGPEARAALAWLGADAASVGHKIAFAEAHPDLATVAHEVTHVLQAQSEPGPGSDSEGIVERDSAAEREAEQVAGDIAASPELRPAAPLDVSGSLPAAGIALQRSETGPPSPEGGLAVLERPVEPAPPEPDEAPAVEPAAAAPTAEAAPLQPEAGGAPAAAAEDAATAELTLPPAPEPGVSAEDVAAREAALAEAEAVLAAARDAPQLLGGFAAAPPTLKASQQAQLGEQLNNVTAQESQQYQEELPDFHATLSGEAEPAAPLAVEPPAPRDLTLEAAPPPPAPEPDIPPTPDPGHFGANAGLAGALNLEFAGEPADKADAVGESLREVHTTDPDIARTPGPPPTVPLEGENDPQRLADQASEGIAGARGARDEAHAAVVNGPGPEQAQPIQLDETYAVDALNVPAVAPVAPAEGAQAYVAMGMPPEVQTAFDQQQQAAMQESMAGAVSQTEGAATARDEERQAEVATAETQAATLSQDADTAQRGHIGDARATIQQERQTALDAQTAAVTTLEGDAETRREADREAIDTRVNDDQALIQDRYESTETDVETEVQVGERQAEAEKQEAEQEAEEESWWDQAVSFVQAAFNTLVSAINAVFDAVRAAVNALLDAAKAFAMELIDAAASFIKDAIAAYGEFLKFAVDGLLGDIFPGLAAALTEAIDGAVAAAQGLVDVVADGLKAGVAALVDGLKAGLNRILDIYQAALNVAVGLVQAALTGDWSALARKLLEAALLVIGVDPESFYAFIGRAEETFQIIIDDPLGFLGNVVEGFLGGVRLFATNILTHLQAGIIGWLTGALGSAGITLPERFDLIGVLDIARQILGLTWERLREKAVELVGEQNVARLEFLFSYIQTLVTEGWAGLWERIQNDLAMLRDQVLGAIQSYLVERVILAAVTRIATLFNPVGALVQLLLAAWNLFTFLRDKLQQIFAVVQAVIDAIGDIARGVLEPAMARVEGVLASLLPLALDLLARLLGLGNVGQRVREIVEDIRATIDRAIDNLIQRVLAAFSGDTAAGPAADPASREIQEEVAADEEEQTFTEPFSIGTEPHTLQAVFDDGRLSIKMASDGFQEVPVQVLAIQQNYIGEDKLFHPSTDLARELIVALEAIVDYYITVDRAAKAAPDEVQAAQIITEGLDQLRLMFASLGEYPFRLTSEQGYVPPTHRADGLPVESAWGRARAFWGQPISSASEGQGGPAAAYPPGIYILDNVPGVRQYQRGHLLAGTSERSLGGPGNDLRNLVPLAPASNIEMRDLPELAARTMIYDTAAQPPYVLKYTASAVYGGDAPLRTVLTAVGAPPASVASLFGLARANTDLTDPVLQTALDPAGTGTPAPTPAQYNDVRWGLARAFMPTKVTVEIEPIAGPVLNILTYSVPNHK